MSGYVFSLKSFADALTYIKNNPDIKYYQNGSKAGGFLLPHSVSQDEAYHLYLVQRMNPALVSRQFRDITVLSITGQELLGLITHDGFIESLKERISINLYIDSGTPAYEVTDAHAFHELWLYVSRSRMGGGHSMGYPVIDPTGYPGYGWYGGSLESSFPAPEATGILYRDTNVHCTPHHRGHRSPDKC